MSYCINPWCSNRQNQQDALVCANCETTLVLDDRFRVLRPISVRQFHPFDVFEAIDLVGTPIRSVNTNVILKVLKGDTQNFLKLFEHEFDALVSLQHPSIPESDPDDFFLVGVGREHEVLLHCLAMSKFDGTTLTEWSHKNKRISQDKLLDWAGQIAEILDYMHGRGYIHRDIKPDNIIVQPNHKLALIDFGGCKEITDSYIAKLSNPGNQNHTQIYSLLYSAPEQIDGKATPQSDFFSMGRTLIFAATGKELNTLSRNDSTGELNWFRDAPQLDSPVKRFIQSLVNPVARKRPLSSGELVSTIFYNLPQSLKWMRIRRSWIFRSILVVLFVLVSFVCFQVGRLILSDSYYNSGVNQLNSNHLRLSKISLQKSIETHETEKAYLSLGEACKLDKDDNCAINSYRKVTELNKKNAIAYFNLAILYEDHLYKSNKPSEIDEDKYNLAVDSYKKAALISFENPIYINNLARLYIIKGDYVSAERLIKSSLDNKTISKSSNMLALLYKNWGWAKFQQGKLDIAMLLLTQSAGYNQPLASTHCLLALIKDTDNERDMCFDADAEDVASPEVKKWQKIFYTKSIKNR